MADFFESKSFVLPSEVKEELAAQLKETRGAKSLELHFKGDDLKGAKEFSDALTALRKSGVKISHEFSIKLDFPRALSKQKTLSLVERMPKPVNGFAKVRMELGSLSQSPVEAES